LGNVATFTFAGDFTDGNYRATLSAAGITDASNLHPARNFNYDFFALAGDVNSDRAVDFADLVILSQNYGQPERTRADGDLNGDGSVDFNDLVLLAQDYNSTIPAASAPVPSAGTPVFSTTPINVAKDSGATDVLRKAGKPLKNPLPKRR
jgi:hypothetical protein